MNKIEVNNLNYIINDKKILERIDLSVSGEKFIGILGPNGSGKTTFLKHIYRTIPVGSGKIFINDSDINALSYKDSSKLMTVMKQENQTDFDYTILEMVMMGRAPHRKFYEKDTYEDFEKAKKALEYVGLHDRMKDSFRLLSGGEKQRVLLARSITQDVDFFLLDEPTNNLDLYYQWKIIRLIKNLDKTVIAILHEINLAFRFCDYIYVIHEGKVHSCGHPDEVITKKMLKEVMKIDADIIEKDHHKFVVVNDTI